MFGKKNIAIVVHGGAGPDTEFIRKHEKEYKQGIEDAVNAGYNLLEKGGSAVEAVEAAVQSLEDNRLFNAGKGSAIKASAEVEMCASIMEGKKLNSGAVAIVKNIKNPISLARNIMEKTDYIYLGDNGAMAYAKKIDVKFEPDAYFITEHQYDAYLKKKREEGEAGVERSIDEKEKAQAHGTVGAAALDKNGNVAAATSTGGTEYSKEGRIGDSSIIGAGTYADNRTCAVSTTGNGELLIRGVTAYDVSALMKYKELDLQEAAETIVHDRRKEHKDGGIGLIALDASGNIAAVFNSERMHRGWKTSTRDLEVHIY